MEKNYSDFSLLLKPYCTENQIEMFLQGENKPPVSGLLLNPTVSFPSSFFDSYEKDPIDSLLYRFQKEEDRLGKSVPHFGGGFYILDPSSALISYYLKNLVKEHPLVIDLCAAPGGKSIAFSFRRNDSLIVSNDISYTRALEIQKNADRLGLMNILSMSINPMKLSLPNMFDLVILDVPCSGSGMIRKDPKMGKDWSSDKVSRLLPIQKDLLEKGYQLLKKDGILAYSTCSLSIEEDENQMEAFLKKHPDIEEIKVEVQQTVVKGSNGYHMIPGIYEGEGIYFCLLRKKEGTSYLPKEIKYDSKNEILGCHAFSYKKNIYHVPRFYSELTKLPFISPGIKTFDDSDYPKCQFDHAYCKLIDNIPVIEIEDDDAIRYVKGEEIKIDSSIKDSLVVLSYKGLRLGFGKKVNSRVKNYLPKGLRTGLLPLEK